MHYQQQLDLSIVERTEIAVKVYQPVWDYCASQHFYHEFCTLGIDYDTEISMVIFYSKLYIYIYMYMLLFITSQTLQK